MLLPAGVRIPFPFYPPLEALGGLPGHPSSLRSNASHWHCPLCLFSAPESGLSRKLSVLLLLLLSVCLLDCSFAFRSEKSSWTCRETPWAGRWIPQAPSIAHMIEWLHFLCVSSLFWYTLLAYFCFPFFKLLKQIPIIHLKLLYNFYS